MTKNNIFAHRGVHDNINRAEALLRNMEEKTGCVRRDLAYRKAIRQVLEQAESLLQYNDEVVCQTAKQIVAAVSGIEE